MLLKSGSISVRSLTAADAGNLHKWLNDPRVLAFYEGRDRPHTYEMIWADFYSGGPIHRCIVEYGDEPIGYLQFYLLDDALCREYQYLPLQGNCYGIDQFIGEPEYWNRGIGRGFIRLVLDYLTRECGASAVILDPHCDNSRALRCYEACGFRKVKLLPKHEWHEGAYRDCWLMEYRSTQ